MLAYHILISIYIPITLHLNRATRVQVFNSCAWNNSKKNAWFMSLKTYPARCTEPKRGRMWGTAHGSKPKSAQNAIAYERIWCDLGESLQGTDTQKEHWENIRSNVTVILKSLVVAEMLRRWIKTMKNPAQNARWTHVLCLTITFARIR